MKKSTILLSLGLILGSTALAGGAGTPAVKPPAGAAACPTITQIVASDPQFSTLLTAVQAAGLADTLSSGSYTVFAPTNAAFAKVPSDTLSNLLNDPAMLRAVLLYHVVPGRVSAKQVMSLKSAKTANGANVSVSVMGGKVMINTAMVIKADVCASNGLVHVIDSVLLPPMAAAPAAAPVAAAPAPAPAPAPAAAAPAAPATPEFNVSNIPVTPQPRTSPVPAATTNTAAPAAPANTAAPAATTTDTAAAATNGSIYDVIAADERFSTLANFLSDAGLDETLMTGEYTIFAPTNDAFAKLDDNTLAVIASDTELLKKILLNHVVAGRVPASQVVTSTQLKSAEGSSLSVTVVGSDVTVGTAKVLATDIAAPNGIIHAIDTVLVPADVTIPAPAAVAADTSATPAPAPVTVAPVAPAATPAATTSVATPAVTAPAATPAPAADTSGGIVATNMTIADVINADARFSTLKTLIAQAGGTLNATLASTGPYTVFLPTNSAFAKVPAATLSQLTSNREELTRVLTYHIARGAFKLADASGKLTSVNSAPLALPLITAAGTSKIGDSTVLYGDVQATNGYINVIDSILMPPAAR